MFLILWVALIVIAVGLLMGFSIAMGLGGAIADRINKGRMPAPVVCGCSAEAPAEPQWFMIVGNQKVPITAEEAKDVKKKGFQVLQE